ncbi:hypothetical protein B7P43_G01833 [Cryptotermes secundus]|uniref:Uncharacterized protein n=1 Tax=Cryptotermes secundus TaxID=105785 RepID=A0A2J7QWB9_9NEOP|nr:hypothetical protein B7P43_G01833 [Cryptotermes secundus]
MLMKRSFNGFCGVPGKDTAITIMMPNTFLALHCALGAVVFRYETCVALWLVLPKCVCQKPSYNKCYTNLM